MTLDFVWLYLKLVIFVSLSDHCMVNFIKENLLGSIKEFRNRFINPIQNGQCADSTLHDVRIMKKRAHILYEMLAGCVQVRQLVKTIASGCFWLLPCCLLKRVVYFYFPQRKDYTALTKFLPPKHEYVLSIRITPIQCKLYRYYLEHFTGENQALMELVFCCCTWAQGVENAWFKLLWSFLVLGATEPLGAANRVFTRSGLIAQTGI